MKRVEGLANISVLGVYAVTIAVAVTIAIAKHMNFYFVKVKNFVMSKNFNSIFAKMSTSLNLNLVNSHFNSKAITIAVAITTK